MNNNRAPDLKSIEWLNSPRMSFEELKNVPVLLNFWNYTNAACLRAIPYMKSYSEKYGKEARILGVHVPLFNFERVPQNVQMALERMGIKYPVLLDNVRALWNTFNVTNRPTFILLDAKGNVRYTRANEGEYMTLEKNLQNLLKEKNPNVKLPELTKEERERCFPPTLDQNMGYLTGLIGNPEGFVFDQIVDYNDPDEHFDGFFYLNGTWQNDEQLEMHARESSNLSDYVALPYRAFEVNAVLAPEKGVPTKAFVMQDGQWLDNTIKGKDVKLDDRGRSFVLVDHPRLYRLVNNKEYNHHELKLATDEPGLGVYQFSFNSCPMA